MLVELAQVGAADETGAFSSGRRVRDLLRVVPPGEGIRSMGILKRQPLAVPDPEPAADGDCVGGVAKTRSGRARAVATVERVAVADTVERPSDRHLRAGMPAVGGALVQNGLPVCGCRPVAYCMFLQNSCVTGRPRLYGPVGGYA